MEFEIEDRPPFIYLAAPFHHEDERISINRVAAVNQYHQMLVRRGFRVFSPLSHSAHTWYDSKNRPANPDYYINLDLEILRTGIFTDMIVLNLPGVELSKDVEKEWLAAEMMGITIRPAEIVPEWQGMPPGLQVPCYCNWTGIEYHQSHGMGGAISELPCHLCGDSGMVTPKFQDRIKIPLILLGGVESDDEEWEAEQ